MGLRILHTADWHMDAPFSGLAPELKRRLRGEQQKLPGRIAEIARREGCDLVLISGDVFDGAYSGQSLNAVRTALEELAVPVFISPGNHDFCGPGSPWLEERWPDNVHIFTSNLESVSLPELDCRVYGAGYQSMDCPGLLEGFHADGVERYQLCVLHGDPGSPYSPYCPVTGLQIRQSGLDYLALGHIHKAGQLMAGRTLCAWPGCPMGRGFDETGEKGVYLVQLDDAPSIRFVPVQGVKFHDLTVQSGEDALSALEEILPAAACEDVFRLTLVGSGAGEIGNLQNRFSHLPNLILKDEREKEKDLWGCVGEDSLEGIYFSILKEKLDSAEPEEAQRILMAAQIARKLLDGREVSL